MRATEFMATFSTVRQPQVVTLTTIGVCSSRELEAKLLQIEGFAQRSGCRLTTREIELCAAIRAELTERA